MQTLMIRQLPAPEGLRFCVQRLNSGGVKTAPAIDLPDPMSQQLGQTQLLFGAELAWYLEHYLDYPYGPHQQRAERVTDALRAWGMQVFDALFGQGQARDWYRDATRSSHADLQLVIVSSDAKVLAWPWEALHDSLVGDLAQHCHIERQLDDVSDPPELHPNLSRERIGILLVTARPFDGDVAYRSISRPLVELFQQNDLPAKVKLLRPPTLAQLRAELQANPGAYHIVHFDGHGSFGQAKDVEADAAAGKFAKGPQGHLLFETDDGSSDPVTAAQLSQLMREHRIPIVVLNACQSAMLSDEADDAFASVATSLIKAGVRSVLAMGYSLYVSAANQFLPDFYRRLFASGSVAEATRAGRQALLARPERVRGFALQDWLVPVLYQQQALPLDFARHATAHAAQANNTLPDEARLNPSDAPHGLIGRDSAVLALERASRRPPAGLLVHGLGGVGKTTLARGYIDWLAHTQGLPAKVVWLSFSGVNSFDYVCNRLVEELLGGNAMAWPDAQKWPALMQTLYRTAALLVWDNFESASGAANTGLADLPGSTMPAADLQNLKIFLEQLRGGKTRVLLTSRSSEAWLGTSACYRVPLGGLVGEERQALAQNILADQGLRLNQRDQATADLIDKLEGHPLMMRALLPKLASQSATSLLQIFEKYQPQANSDDPVEQKLYATLRFVEEGLPAELQPLLYPIGLHEGHVQADVLAQMAAAAGQPFTVQQIQQTLMLLEAAGLVHRLGPHVFRLHPALSRYLRGRLGGFGHDLMVDRWQAGFMGTMGRLADQLAPLPLHEQRPFYDLFKSNVEHARSLARNDGGFENYAALTQFLAAYALNLRNLPLAQAYFEALVQHCEAHHKEGVAATAYHQLGRVAQERRDLDTARRWYLKSLKIKERQGNEHGAASTYHQLGRVAEEQRDFDTARRCYLKSLEINERQGNEHGAAGTYHQLGRVAEEQRDLDTARRWYLKSLEIDEQQGNEHGAASTYHQLGTMAQEQRDFDTARRWYLKSLEICERLGDKHHATLTQQNLDLLPL